jgi:autotransporter-associated beta strand protein
MKTKETTTLTLGLGLLTSVLLLAPATYGKSLTWTGGGANSYWNVSANWGGQGVPANGDYLTFPSGAARLTNTNNLSGLRLASITFGPSATNYDIRGNSLVLSNGFDLLYSTGTSRFHPDITLGAAQSWDFASASATATFYYYGDVALGSRRLIFNNTGFVLLGGAVSGTGGITKTNTGTLSFGVLSDPEHPKGDSRANSYTGTTYVYGGVLELDKTKGVSPVVVPDIALAGNLVIGGGTTGPDAVRLFSSSQIAYTARVAINAAGLLDLNGYDDTIGPLTLQGGVITNTGTGTLTLNGDVIASTAVALVYGNVNLGASTRTFTVADPNPSGADFAIVGNVGGGPAAPGTALRKLGSGEMWLQGDNTFGGEIVVDEGQLTAASSPSALGSTAGGTTVNNSALLALIATSVGGEHLSLNSTNPSGALVSWGGPCAFAGTIDLSIPVVIAAYPDLTLGGVISGPGGFTKIGPGTLTLAGSTPNTYLGDTFVNEGTLELAKGNAVPNGTLIVGDGLGGERTDVVRCDSIDPIGNLVEIDIRSSGLFDLNSYADGVGRITLDGGDVRLGTGTLACGDVTALRSSSVINGPNGALYLSKLRTVNVADGVFFDLQAPVRGPGGIAKTGLGTLRLGYPGTYSGLTLVQQGQLEPWTATSLGTTDSGTIVSNGASLLFSRNVGITNETLTLGGDGAPSLGAVDIGVHGDVFWVGPVILQGQATFVPRAADIVLHIIGPISGPGGITVAGAGTVSFEGDGANTYIGVTRVNSGTLGLNKSIGYTTIPGDLIIGNGVGPANDVRVQSFGMQIARTSDVNINSDGLLDVAPQQEAFDELRGSGHVNLAWGLVLGRNDGSSVFDGVISGPGWLRKDGTGTITLTGTNTYANGTRVSGGTLMVNGYQPQSDIVLSAGCTLGGNGRVGFIFVEDGGNVAPGASPGRLTSGGVSFGQSGHFRVELNGPYAGTEHDQLDVIGTVFLYTPHLQVTPVFTRSVRIGEQFAIINNDGAEAVGGTFQGLPNGTNFSAADFRFRINYRGGDGNDVVLTVIDVPASQSGSAITTGNGNHAIDPNECNLLALAISNQTATPMTGVTATLSTAKAGVMITQPYSRYPDVPASGNCTNLTSFQISTLPSFACGADINLELAVRSDSHGSFIVPVVLQSGEPSASPLRYDVSATANIPDVGTIEFTNVVAGFSGPLTKVAVSLWLTHPFDADLNLALVSPDGVVVDLSSGNGSGANFGSACSPDGSRTTFDDAAETVITAGSPPFSGTFRPEGSLAAFLGGGANGTWRLRITDNNGGTLGALRCWSLFLYPVDCAPGSGVCELCLPPIQGEITSSDPVQSGRVSGTGVASSCASPKPWFGFTGPGSPPLHYDLYSFTNTAGGDVCVTVWLDSPLSGLAAAAYLDTFSPVDVSANYLGSDGSLDSAPPPGFLASKAFSCIIPAGVTFLVVVHELYSSGVTLPYTLHLSGLPCPQPTLAIEPAGTLDKVRLDWPTWAGDYQLVANPSMHAPEWKLSPQEPLVTAGRFTLTNMVTGTNRFFQLLKK